jgi:hypothetical protein
MPIIRKVIPVGKTSKAVIVPKSWLEGYEREAGQPIQEVSMEVNQVLKIKPILPRKASADQKG